jgi:quinol monooxygenase YgiN
MIVVAGHLRVDPAARAEFLERTRGSIALARAAPGCLDFALSADLLDAGRVNVFERWVDRAALEAFRGSGPDDGLGAMIRAFHVEELEATPATP